MATSPASGSPPEPSRPESSKPKASRPEPHAALIAAIHAALATHSDPVRAAGQQRYMKSAMPHHGITSPQLRTLLRPVLAG